MVQTSDGKCDPQIAHQHWGEEKGKKDEPVRGREAARLGGGRASLPEGMGMGEWGRRKGGGEGSHPKLS